MLPLWFLAAQVLAQPAVQPPLKELVVVTAERQEQPLSEATAAVTVLTREDIAALPAENLGELLRFIPGLHVADAVPGAPVILSSRGFFGGGEVDYLQLTIDGVTAGNVESGLADWRQIDLRTVERIEVLRGPASSLFGDTAIVGVIQVTRRQPVESHLSAAAGSHSLAQLSGYSGEVSLGASTTLEAGLKMAGSDGFRDHSSFDERSGYASLRHLAGGGTISGSFDALRREREDPGPRSEDELRTDRFGSSPLFAADEDLTERIRLTVRYDRPGLRISAHTAGRDSDVVRTLLLAAGFGDTARRAIDTTEAAIAAVGERRVRLGQIAGNLVAGAEAARDAISTSYRTLPAEELLASGSGRRERAALFLSSEWRVRPRLRISGGARWDRISDAFESFRERESAVTPRLAVNLGREGRPDLPHGYVQIARAFKAPTLDQRFDPRPFPDGAGGSFTISNPGLQSQRALNLEAGLSQTRSDLAWSATAYAMTVDDEIDFDIATFRYQNIGETSHRGFEGTAQFRTLLLRPRLSYTYTKAEPAAGAHAGRQLKNIPRHAGRLELDTSLSRIGRMLVSCGWTGERFLDDENRHRLDDHVRVDARLVRRFSSFELIADAENVFDQTYEAYGFTLGDFSGGIVPYAYPAAGRTFRLTLTRRIGSPGAVPTPAQ